MNKIYAMSKTSKELVKVVSKRGSVMVRFGKRIRCIEFVDTKSLPPGASRQLIKMPVKMFKNLFSYVDAEVATVLYGT